MKYSAGAPGLRLAYRYLRESKGCDFPDLIAEAAQQEEAQRRMYETHTAVLVVHCFIVTVTLLCLLCMTYREAEQQRVRTAAYKQAKVVLIGSSVSSSQV